MFMEDLRVIRFAGAFPSFLFIQLAAVNVSVKGGDETIEGVI